MSVVEGQRQIHTERVTVPDIQTLGLEWTELERRGQGSFFTSWTWIGLWFEQMASGSDCSLLRARIGGRTIGLALVCRHTVRRARFVPSRCLFVHATGRSDLDQLTVEFNGVLAESGLEDEVSRAFVHRLLDDDDWDELCVDGGDAKVWAQASRSKGALQLVQRNEPDYYVDLSGFRSNAARYLDALKPRVRHHVRRSLREAERLGTVQLQAASSTEEALSFLTGLRHLHQKSWESKGKPGAFSNPQFIGFHEELVRRSGIGGVVDLVCLSVGGTPVGYLYNFVYRGCVYYYQSGFDFAFTASTHWRPGVIAHFLAVQHYGQAGHDRYDFMAGDHAYKKDLSNGSSELSWLTLRRPRLRFRLEAGARRLATMVGYLQRTNTTPAAAVEPRPDEN